MSQTSGEDSFTPDSVAKKSTIQTGTASQTSGEDSFTPDQRGNKIKRQQPTGLKPLARIHLLLTCVFSTQSFSSFSLSQTSGEDSFTPDFFEKVRNFEFLVQSQTSGEDSFTPDAQKAMSETLAIQVSNLWRGFIYS